ncbi:MAG: DUF4124 domain-containing protein [Burkholderiaceae bacterium]
MSRIFFKGALVCALLATPLSATAQLYKWTGSDGVVNYGDSPPSNAKDLRPVTGGTVSVVSGVSKQQMDGLRERDEQRRQQQVQRDASDARAAAVASVAQIPEPVYIDGYAPDYAYRPPLRRPPDGGQVRPRPEQPIVRPTPLPAAPPARGDPPALRGR